MTEIFHFALVLLAGLAVWQLNRIAVALEARNDRP